MNTRRELIIGIGVVGSAGVAGCIGSGESGEECDPSLIEDGVRWRADPEPDFGDIEKVNLSLTNRVEFAIDTTATVTFFDDTGRTDAVFVEVVLEPLEVREFEITEQGLGFNDYEVSLSTECA